MKRKKNEVSTSRSTREKRRKGRIGGRGESIPPIYSYSLQHLPNDLDILYPLSSKTNPCVRTVLYGAIPIDATEVSREL